MKPRALAHRAEPRPRATSLEHVGWQILAGLVLGLLACELCALLAGGAHVTVILGGNG